VGKKVKRSSNKARGGDHRRRTPVDAENRQSVWKIFAQKNGFSVIPEAKRKTYERIGRVKFDRAGLLFEGSSRAARKARDMVESSLLVNVPRLLRLGLEGKDSAAREWAGEVLANIGSRISVEHRKLLKANKSYRDWKRKIGKKLGTVFIPKRQFPMSCR
jgi:hypothetical protein